MDEKFSQRRKKNSKVWYRKKYSLDVSVKNLKKEVSVKNLYRNSSPVKFNFLY